MTLPPLFRSNPGRLISQNFLRFRGICRDFGTFGLHFLFAEEFLKFLRKIPRYMVAVLTLIAPPNFGRGSLRGKAPHQSIIAPYNTAVTVNLHRSRIYLSTHTYL